MVRKCCSVCWNICWRCCIPDLSWWHKQHTRKVRKSKCRLCSPCEEGLLVAGSLISLGLILSTSPWQPLLLLLSQHLFCPGNQFGIFLFQLFCFFPQVHSVLALCSLFWLLWFCDRLWGWVYFSSPCQAAWSLLSHTSICHHDSSAWDCCSGGSPYCWYSCRQVSGSWTCPPSVWGTHGLRNNHREHCRVTEQGHGEERGICSVVITRKNCRQMLFI